MNVLIICCQSCVGIHFFINVGAKHLSFVNDGRNKCWFNMLPGIWCTIKRYVYDNINKIFILFKKAHLSASLYFPRSCWLWAVLAYNSCISCGAMQVCASWWACSHEPACRRSSTASCLEPLRMKNSADFCFENCKIKNINNNFNKTF